MNLADFSVIVFDLDDTLYLERDYVASGFLSVANWLTREFAWSNERRAAFGAACWERFAAGQRQQAFDHTLREFGLPAEPSLIEQCVQCYRQHRPHIGLVDDAAAVLQELQHRDSAVWIITDGHLGGQRAKVRALGLQPLVKRIVYTDDWGRSFWKPHPRAFQYVQAHERACSRQCVYVGDNPAKDFNAPRELGWLTIRVRRPLGLHAHEDGVRGMGAELEWNDLRPLIEPRVRAA